MPEEKKVVAKFVPNLNRKGVGDWVSGRSNLISFDDFGLYHLAFKRWHFIPGERGTSYWACVAKILEVFPAAPPEMPELKADSKTGAIPEQVKPEVFQAAINKCRFDPRLPGFKNAKGKDRAVLTVGTEATLLFPVGRKPTAKQPNLEDIDDRNITAFLRAVLSSVIPKGTEVDMVGLFSQLEDFGRVEHDLLTFAVKCMPFSKRNEIVDPGTGEVLKISVQINGNRYFDPWAPEPDFAKTGQ